MDPSPWSPYKKPISHLSCGSPLTSLVLPPSPHEDSLNNCRVGLSNSMLQSPSQGLQQLNGADQPVELPGLPNSHYEPLLTPPMHPSKETSDFFCETLFNGVCKENQPSIQNFIQASGTHSQNENISFPCSENSVSGYRGQVSLPFHSSAIDRPSPGPFGVLPHEAVMTRPNRYERNNDKFISPVSKTASASYNSGPYADRDVNSIYSSAPLSAQSSAFSGDNASLSPIVNSVTSPTISNFSSPSDYYSSPKPNFGAYNSLQSPVPQSPSVAQHSYPSSPFTNVEGVAHVPNAPPCSPMGGSPYMNNLNQVPQRNGLKSQHSPSSSVGSNSVMCYPQNVVHHGSVLPKTPDYHSDYGVYGVHDHNVSPSSFPSVYPPMLPSQMNMGNNSRISPQSHSQHMNTMPHDSRMAYGHPPIQQSSMSSPTYNMQNKMGHDVSYGACSSSISPGQSMHPSRYPSCSTPMNSMRNAGMHPNLPSVMTSHMSNEAQFGYQQPDIVDEKTALDMFNTHVDSGVHNPDNNSAITNFLESSELPILDPELLNNRQLELSDNRELNQNSAMNVNNSNLTPHPPMLNRPHTNEIQHLNYFNSTLDVARPGNFTYNSYPRRRGRRGRRRKATNHSNDYSRFQSFKNEHSAYNNGYSVPPSKILDYGNTDCYNNFSKRMCDMRELPPVNYPLSQYRSELRMSDNQKRNSDLVSKTQKRYISVEEDLKFLGELTFPGLKFIDAPHTFMKTRNKDTEGFLQCYKNFLANWKSEPEPDPEPSTRHEHVKNQPKERHKSHRSHPPKLIIRMGRCNREWVLKETHISPVKLSDSDESASTDSVDVLSSHKIKQDNENYNGAETGNSSKVYEKLSKHSAKRKHRDSVDHSDKYNDLKENNLHFTNYETLPAGKMKIKTEIIDDAPSSIPGTEPPNVPKKRGRKAKNATVSQEQPKKRRRSSAKTEPINDLQFTIKQEPIDEDDVQFECSRRVLRSRKDDSASKDPQPGPSIKKEPIDISSDEVDIIDDSDSDPAWTPSAKQPKLMDALKCHIKLNPSESGVKKVRRRRQSRKNSAAGPAGRKKKDKIAETIPRKRATCDKSPSSAVVRSRERLREADFKIKKERVPEYFVIAKSDLDEQEPNIWRVDRDTQMLQRFDAYTDKAGLLLHRNTYTYAAWNEMSVHNYLKINVKILSRSHVLFVVQYLGLDGVEATLECTDMPIDEGALKRENFEVFLQSLLSQALDPNFLSEITNEKDTYFLDSIAAIDAVTDTKKQILVKSAWDEELKNSADTYPCVNILDSITDEVQCQVCHEATGIKLLQFYGQPYDHTNLGSIDTPLSIKTQFNVCNVCSTTVSLYNCTHHSKYNFFVECRTKLNNIKSDKESVTSHTLLDDCLQDHDWVDSMFKKLEDICKDCDRNS